MSFDEDVLARAARVRLLLMDVDGVMTDGTYWNVPDGQGGLAEIKAFDSQDGIAFQWLRRFGIQAGVISGRVSVATEERARSAGFAHVYQGHTEKIPILEEILEKAGLQAEQVGYVGDDFTDVVVMHRVGLGVATANAKPEVKAEAHWVTPSPGGHGALRDVVELLLKAQGRWEEILRHYEIGRGAVLSLRPARQRACPACRAPAGTRSAGLTAAGLGRARRPKRLDKRCDAGLISANLIGPIDLHHGSRATGAIENFGQTN